MYRARLLREIDGWVGRGLIAAEAGERLRDDVRARVGAVTFGNVLFTLAAVLVAAAVLTFVAANWEGVPRLGRVAMIFALVTAGPLAGSWLVVRGQWAAGEGVRLVGSAAFGAGIALVGQMYHLTGDEAAAILLWCAGTAAAAALMRSPTLTIGAVLLSALYLAYATRLWGESPAFPWFHPGLLAVLWGLSLWTGNAVARRLLVLELLHFALHVWIELDTPLVGAAVAVLAAGLFLAATLRPSAVDGLLRLDGAAPFLALLAFGISLVALQLQFEDDFAFFLGLAILGLVAAVAVLWGAGDSRAVRAGAYVLFAVEVMIVYFFTVGGLIGSAAFFLSAGLALAVAAVVILRIERRIAARQAGGAP